MTALNAYGFHASFLVQGSMHDVFEGLTWWVSQRGFTEPNVRTDPVEWT